MVKAAKRFESHRFVIAAAPNIGKDFYRKTLVDASVRADIDLVYNATFSLLHFSEAALVTSGTATLETAVVGTPQVVCYRANGSKLAYKLFEKILNVRFVSLPNLIADRKVVPELLLHHCNDDNMAAELIRLLDFPAERKKMLDGYREIAERLGHSDSADEAARRLFNDLKSGK